MSAQQPGAHFMPGAPFHVERGADNIWTEIETDPDIALKDFPTSQVNRKEG